MANNLVAGPSNNICDAVKFMILNTQQSNGMFREVGTVAHEGMIVRVLISLTSILHPVAKQKTISK